MNKVKDKKNVSVNIREFPVSIIYFFLSSQMVFNFDFGFSTFITISVLNFLHFLNNITSLAYILILLAPIIWTTMYRDVTCWCSLLAYLGYVIVVKRSKYKIYNLIVDVNKIFKMNTLEKRIISVFVIIFTISMIATKFIFHIIQCTITIGDGENKMFCPQFNIKYYIVYYFPYSSVDIITTAEIIIYYYIYCCIRKLKGWIGMPGQNMKLALMKYAAIADCCDKIKPLFDDLVNT